MTANAKGPKSPCPLDGNLRSVVDRDRYGVTWKCAWCGEHSREEFDPTPANDVQRSFDR
jgi:hypothetical protein